MTTKETPRKDQPAQTATDESQPRKRRKHGYRGYPNKPNAAGDVHFGTGFAGTGSTSGSGRAALPESGVITERTRDDAEGED
jgi:hypothetical protein